MGIRQTLKKWSAYQQTVRELAALDNRQLNDLGISRTDIQKIAREHARALSRFRAPPDDDFDPNARFLLRQRAF
jgi:uncharacterized protein YjiS (DUF1127 family)